MTLVPGVDYEESCCPVCGETHSHDHDWAEELGTYDPHDRYGDNE